MSNQQVKLKNVRLSFPDLFEARQFENKGDARYGAVLLIEKGSDNHKLVTVAIKNAAMEAWKEKAGAKLKTLEGNSNKYCYMDGDLNEDRDGYAGHMALSARRKLASGRPLILDRDGKSPLTAEDGRPYAGCYVNAVVEVWAQDGQYTGIRCTLLGVQFAADGDAFTAGGKASPDDFEDLSTDEVSEIA